MSPGPGPGRRAGPAGSPGGVAPGAAPPPFRLPGEHFAAALAFFVLGAAALAWRAPELARGAFSDPGVIAATHLFTLGWISTSIMGALYQFLPVALGASVRWERLGHATFWAWVAGLAAFAGGLVVGEPGAYLSGAGLLGLAVLLFVANLSATLRRAPRRGLTWWCLVGAAVSLVGAWVLGFLLSVNLRSGLLGTGRYTVVAVHFHIAAAGWVLLTVVGVAHRLLPMFLLSHGASRIPERVAAALLAAGTLGLLLSDHLLGLWVLRPAAWLLAAGTAAFILQAALHYRHARRPKLDPGMRLVAGGLCLLAAATALGILATTPVPGALRPRWWTAYGVTLLPGGIGLFVAGHYYKILPFLTWFHRFGPVAAEREVPKVADLYDPTLASAAGALLVLGAAGLTAAILAGAGGVARAAGLVFLTGAGVQAFQMAGVARSRPAPRDAARAEKEDQVERRQTAETRARGRRG